jgi:hypothetical protein
MNPKAWRADERAEYDKLIDEALVFSRRRT